MSTAEILDLCESILESEKVITDELFKQACIREAYSRIAEIVAPPRKTKHRVGGGKRTTNNLLQYLNYHIGDILILAIPVLIICAMLLTEN